MDNPAFTACFEACSQASRRASKILADHQDCMRRCQEQLALARKLLARPIYPYGYVPQHDPFDLDGLKPGG